MFTKKSNTKSIDDEVEHVLTSLKDMKPGTDEYEKTTANLEALCNARSYKKPPRWGVEPETIVLAVTNILGIILVINHENLHVISTKALGLIAKSRI